MIRHCCRIINEPTAAATITTMVLGKVKETTRAYLSKGTVTVVACLFNTEHQVTKDTGTIAGLQILHVINKPTAATITYGFDKAACESRIIVVT
ncbi:heat shock protein 70kDa [Lactarius deliciosus]|nr:heat shock protein 70kDa [Lactarius deliciosus]KAH9028842.1 heat shock protein 70kDa [Lactarius deliciosus]